MNNIIQLYLQIYSEKSRLHHQKLNLEAKYFQCRVPVLPEEETEETDRQGERVAVRPGVNSQHRP